jgi:hypothetical protein
VKSQNAADLFVRNAETFESKFGSPASEEQIWRDACELKFLNSMPKQERKKLEQNGGISTLFGTIPQQDLEYDKTRWCFLKGPIPTRLSLRRSYPSQGTIAGRKSIGT